MNLDTSLHDFIFSSEAQSMVHHIVDTWKPDDGKCILLVLPCSSRKPYRMSQSQRLYLDATYSSLSRASEFIEVATLSAVFGIVPRVYEDLPIITSYDFSLNRSSHTLGRHNEIIQVTTNRVRTFFDRHAKHFSSIVFYGRDRYITVMEHVVEAGYKEKTTIVGEKGLRLKGEGLTRLKAVLEKELDRFG